MSNKLTNTCSELTNSFFVTMVALSTAKTTNSGKTIYFLTLISCSINSLSCYSRYVEFHYVDHVKLSGKKMFAPRNGGKGGGGG